MNNLKSIVLGLFFSLVLYAGADTTDQSEIEYELPLDSLLTSTSIASQDSSQIPPLEKEPILLKFIKIEYPLHLSRLGVQGTVVVDILINENGLIDSIALVRGIHPELDSQVVAAVKKFTFSPAIAEGKPVAVIVTYEYRITLDVVTDSIREYCNFTGTILERGTRTPVPDAQIAVTYKDTAADSSLRVPFSVYLQKIGTMSNQVLDEKSIITTTDSLGNFSFVSLPGGNVKVQIIATGYEAFITEETISKSEVTDATYRIMRSSYSDYEITVYGKSEQKEVAKRSLSIGEIKKLPGFGGDAVKVVQALPGVARPSFGSGAVIVRGAPTWDSRFLLDGILIPQLYHFGGVKSTYNSDALASVDLYPGGFGVRYGSTVAGVIELTGRSAASTDRLKGFADVNLFDATLFAESPIGDKAGVIVSARRSYIGEVMGAVVDRLDLPVTVVPYYYDYLVRSDFNVNKRNSVFLTLFGSKDKLLLIAPFVRGGSKDVDELTDQLNQMSAFNMVLVGWNAQIGNNMENSLRCAFNRGYGSGSMFGIAKWDFNSWEYYLRDDFKYPFSDKIIATAGCDLSWIRYFQKSKFPLGNDNTFLRDTINERFGLVGPFTQFEYKPIDNLQITTGIRYDYYNELQYNGSIVPEIWDYASSKFQRGFSGEPSLRLNARFLLPDRQTVKMSFGTYNQTPQPIGIATHTILGNPYIPATKARHLVTGYERQITDLIFADVQLYHNQQWDIPEFSTKEDLRENPGAPAVVSRGKGRMYGLELLLRHDQGTRFFGWMAYSLSRSERYNMKEKKYTFYNNDQTHNLQLIASYKLKKEWQVGSRLRFVSGNPYSKVVSTYFIEDYPRGFSPRYGPENAERNDPFFQLDVRVDKKIIFKKWIFSGYIDLQNVLVFLYASPEFTLYNEFKEKVTINFPFLPSFGFRAEF